MKKSIAVWLTIIVAVMIAACLAGCVDVAETDYLAAVNKAFLTVDTSTGAVYDLAVKEGDVAVYTQNTRYTVQGDSVNYTTTTVSPDPDLFGEEPITQTAQGTLTATEYRDNLYYGLTLAPSDLDGKVVVAINETEATYTFVVKDKSLLVNAEQGGSNGGVRVSIKTVEDKLTEITLQYNDNGYVVYTKYTIVG